MKKILETCEKYNSWALLILLGVLAVFEFIYRIGVIDTVGFAQAFAQIITIFLLFAIIASMILAMIKKKTGFLTLTGAALLGYYIISIALGFPQAFTLFESKDWSLIMSGSFMVISLILVVLVVTFYLISVYFDKYHYLNNASIFLLGANVIFSILALIMDIVGLARADGAWFSYFYSLIKFGVAPLLTFFGVMYLFPKVNALGGGNSIEAEVLGVTENDTEE